VDTFDYLTHYDSYYYARSGRVPTLPVWRVQGRDRAKTLVYLSPDTGEIVGRADRWLRARRWLVTGFHAWDWPFLLERPLLRDAIVVLLAGGGLLLSLSGLYLGSSHLVWLIRRRRRS